MNTQTDTSAPRTAPHVAVAVFAAIAIIIGLHLAGFHFVVAGGAGR